MSDLVTYALLVNPKTGELFSAKKKSDEFLIVNMGGVREGKGYFDSGGDSDYSASERSGFPRVHTPSGVRSEGAGNGTVLYTALCAAAKLEYEGQFRGVYVNTSGPGVSSNEHRSTSANRWWNAARTKYGLVKRHEACGEDEFDDEFDIDDGTAESLVESRYDNVSSINIRRSGSVNIIGSFEQCSMADTYAYDAAEEHGLVVCMFPKPRDWSRLIEIPYDKVDYSDKEVLVAANFGMLGDVGMDDDTAAWLFGLAAHLGVSAKDLEGIAARYQAGVDEDMSVWKRFGDMVPVEESAGGDVMRENPRGKRRKNPGRKMVSRPTTELRPTRMAPMKPILYGKSKKRRNPAGPMQQKALASMSRVHEIRAKLGWPAFQENP